MSVLFFMVNLQPENQEYSFGFFGVLIASWILYLFSIFVLNFISQKNELASKSSYRLVLFAALTASFPDGLRNIVFIANGIFILFVIRRLLSLRSGKNTELKLFDAGFWLCLATLAYFWSFLLFLLVILALIFYAGNTLRYWFIPFLGTIAIAILAYCYLLATNQDLTAVLQIFKSPSLDFSSYSTARLFVPIAFFISLFIWSVSSFIVKMKNSNSVQRPMYIEILFFALITLGMVIFSHIKTGADWYLFAIPFAIIGASYFDSSGNKWMPEIFLWVIILMPFVVYFL